MIMLDKYVEFLRLYRIRNGYNIRSSLGVIFITRKMRENKLRQYRYRYLRDGRKMKRLKYKEVKYK